MTDKMLAHLCDTNPSAHGKADRELPAAPRHPHYKADTRQGATVESLAGEKAKRKGAGENPLPASNRIRIEKSSGHKGNPCL